MTRARTTQATLKSVEQEMDVWEKFHASLREWEAAEAALGQASIEMARDVRGKLEAEWKGEE